MATPTASITPTVTNAMLSARDVDSEASGVVYTMIAQPAEGTLRLDGEALEACGVFTQADIDNNLVSLAVVWEGADIDTAFAFNVANEANCAGPGTAFTIEVTALP